MVLEDLHDSYTRLCKLRLIYLDLSTNFASCIFVVGLVWRMFKWWLNWAVYKVRRRIFKTLISSSYLSFSDILWLSACVLFLVKFDQIWSSVKRLNVVLMSCSRSDFRIPGHLSTYLSMLWRTSHVNTKETIVIQWHANMCPGILKFSRPGRGLLCLILLQDVVLRITECNL